MSAQLSESIHADRTVRCSLDVERLDDNEAATIEHLSERFDTTVETASENYGHAVRSVHAKSHGILDGLLTIDAGLPPTLAQGLFATAGTQKVVMRLSTNAGDILPETISLPLGLALKVTGVAGERLLDGSRLLPRRHRAGQPPQAPVRSTAARRTTY